MTSSMEMEMGDSPISMFRIRNTGIMTNNYKDNKR